MPRMRSTTRRALRGVTRTYRAIALASIASSPSLSVCADRRLTPAAAVVPDMAAERPGGRELTELVADHRLGDENRDVLAAVVNRDGVAEHRRHDHGTAGPRLDDVPGALVVLGVHLFDQVVVDKRAFLKTTRHREVLLPLLLAAPAGDHPVARLVGLAGAPLRLAPRADRVTAAGTLALATAERVVDRVHRHPAHLRAASLPAAAAGLAELDVALLGVADLAHGRPAGPVHPPDLPRGHAQLCEAALLGQQLDAGAGRAGDLGSATGPQLDRVHHGAGRDVAQRQAVAGADVRAGAVFHPVPLGQALRAQDVALLAVRVVQQRDPGRAVGVVLQVRHLGRHPVLVGPAEVDQPVGALVAAALVPHGDPAVQMPATAGIQRADERLLGLAAGDLGEVRPARAPPARRGRLVLADSHVCSDSCRKLTGPPKT